MKGRLIIALTFGLIVGVGCKADSSDSNASGGKDAVETNVLRHDCEDAGPCDAGEPLSGEPGEATPCDDDDDCPDGQRCTRKMECAPQIASE